MKAPSIIIALFLLFATDLRAQKIQAYDAFVKTESLAAEKGILYHVSEGGIVLQRGDSLIAINAADIKTIKIYTSSTPYKYKKVFTYDPWADNNFETRPNQIMRTRKFGEEDPSLGEEIGGHIATAAINGALNLVALPFSAIRTNIYKANVNYKADKFKKIKNELYYYSIHYQLQDSGTELKKAQAAVKQSAIPKP